ncbi:hypothetical protein SSX86_003000 [Deinandra increscens subsp. villosa]|uniref:Uncharacterized protein n=1 Tax=Deinandra increscens subsp. villosa TaxID=3103831 RepID=A0AAP0DPR3_9ASTR
MKTGNKISQIVRLKQLVHRWRRRLPPAGSLAVYVGAERRRFVIPTRFLNLHVFVSLLHKAEEEFGFRNSGGLILPCDVVTFNKLLSVLNRDERGVGDLDFDDFTAMFSDPVVDSSSSCKYSSIRDSRSFNLMLPKAKPQIAAEWIRHRIAAAPYLQRIAPSDSPPLAVRLRALLGLNVRNGVTRAVATEPKPKADFSYLFSGDNGSSSINGTSTVETNGN